MGVRFIVIPERLAPAPYDRDPRPVPARLVDALGQQLDLENVPINDAVTVFQNDAFTPVRSLLPAAPGDRSTLTSAVGEDLSKGTGVLAHDHGPTTATGHLGRTGDVLVSSSASSGWSLKVAGVPMERSTAFGFANQFAVTRTGDAQLTYHTSPLRDLELAGQIVLWLLVVFVWRRYRRSDRQAAR
jgi:hypothetical protein